MNIKLLIPVVVAAVALSSCVHHHAPLVRHSNPVVVKQVVQRHVAKKQVVHQPAKPAIRQAAKPHVAKPVANKRADKGQLAALDKRHKKH